MEVPSSSHLLLHLGEMSAQELRTAKAAYTLAIVEMSKEHYRNQVLTPVSFGELQIGDHFVISKSHYGEYENIKVFPARMTGDKHYGEFNVIDLCCGTPRIFHDNVNVFRIDNAKINRALNG